MAENVTDNVTCSAEEISNIIDENFSVDEDEEENDSLDDGNEEVTSTDLVDMTELNSNIKDTLCDKFRSQFTLVLARLKDRDLSVDSEAEAASIIYEHYASKTAVIFGLVEEFLVLCASLVQECYDKVKEIKVKEEKQIQLEQPFLKFSSLEDPKEVGLSEKWKQIVLKCGISLSDISDNLFYHVIQHFWSTLMFSEEAIPSEMKCVVDDTNLETTQDKLGDDAIMYHGGWAFRRARDEIIKGPDVISILDTLDSETYTEVQKSKVLALIKSLGKDRKSEEDGKFYFYPEQDLLALFKFLHIKSSTLLKANIEQADSKAVVECLKVLSVNIQLRNLWGGIIDKLHTEKTNTSESSVLLMHVATMFVKSKQQRIREQLDIKPDKKSKSHSEAISRGKKKQQKPNDQQAIGPQIISEVQKVFKKPEQLFEKLIHIANMDNAKEVLHFLDGKLLTKILKALSKPGLNKKAKSKQIDSLLLALKQTPKPTYFKFPEKLYAD